MGVLCISLTSYPVCLGVILHSSPGSLEVSGFKSLFIRCIEYLKHRLRLQTSHKKRSHRECWISSFSSETPAGGPKPGAWQAPASRNSASRTCEGGGRQLTYRGVSVLLPPGGVLAREARGRWPCSVFRIEAVAAAAAVGTGILVSWALELQLPQASARPFVPRREPALLPPGDAFVLGSGALWEFMLRWSILATALIALCRRSASFVASGEPPGFPLCPWRR